MDAPLNLRHFDKIVVVTTPTDRQTQDLCKFYDVECVTTHSFYHDNAKFQKSRGINEGLAKLDRDAYVAHLGRRQYSDCGSPKIPSDGLGATRIAIFFESSHLSRRIRLYVPHGPVDRRN